MARAFLGALTEFRRLSAAQADDLHKLLSCMPSGVDARVVSRIVACPSDAPLGLLLLVAAAADRPPHALDVALAACLSRVPAALDGSVHSEPSPHAIMLVPQDEWDIALKEVAELAADVESVVLAAEPLPAAALSSSYERAVTLARLAIRVSRRPRLVSADDLALFAAIEDLSDDSRDALFGRVVTALGSCRSSTRRAHLDTVLALHYADGDRARAADMLALSHSGLRFRIRQLEHLTGLRFDRPADRLRLDLAAHWLHLVDPSDRDIALLTRTTDCRAERG